MKKHISFERLMEIIQKVSGGLDDRDIDLIRAEFDKLTIAYVPGRKK